MCLNTSQLSNIDVRTGRKVALMACPGTHMRFIIFLVKLVRDVAGWYLCTVTLRCRRTAAIYAIRWLNGMIVILAWLEVLRRS